MPVPKSITDLFSPDEPGKRLVDPQGMQQLITLVLGFQSVPGSLTLPGPLMSQATNTVTGTGPGTTVFNCQLPLALAGRRVTIVNATPGNLSVNPQLYNPATGGPDGMTTVAPIPAGFTWIYLAYQVGQWVTLSGSSPTVDDPIEEPEC